MPEEITYIIIGVIALACILLAIFLPLSMWIIRRTRLEKHIQQRFKIRDKYQEKSKSFTSHQHSSNSQVSVENYSQQEHSLHSSLLQSLQSPTEHSSDLSTLLTKSHTSSSVLPTSPALPASFQLQSQSQELGSPSLPSQLSHTPLNTPHLTTSLNISNAPAPINISELHSNPQDVSYAFIINPSKPRAREIERRIREFFKNHHLKTPLFIYTTLEKDGSACAQEALAQGVHVVVACGGDGTVRTVAEAMAHSGRIMGVLPSGTANLFCRNIGIPLNNVELALQIIISPGSRHVDMGWITLDASIDDTPSSPTPSIPAPTSTSSSYIPPATTSLPTTQSPTIQSSASQSSASQSSATQSLPSQSPPSPASVPSANTPNLPIAKKTHGFLLIAGAGFDATMIKAADPNLKKTMGWVAYFVGGLNHLYDRKFSGKISVRYKGDKELSPPSSVTFRSFLIGNCGRIPLFSLIPNADISDGFLDFELLDTNHGIVGWVYLAGDVVHQTIANKAQHGSFSSQEARIIHSQGTEATMELEKPIPVQADGDLLGSSSSIRTFVDPGALIIRAPLSQDQTDATGLLSPIKA